jgi:hypothetical protein
MNSENPLCPNCEIPVHPHRDQECPKCGEPIRGKTLQGLLEVDVAHSGETWQDSREKIMKAFDQGLQYGHSGVKIIHGYGASTGRTVIREQAVRLMKSLAVKHGGKLTEDRTNPGAHILWLD